MVKGSKYLGTSVEYEESHYIYNGLGYLIANEWIIAKNGYGYHGLGTNLDPLKQENGVVAYDRCILHSLVDNPYIMKLEMDLGTAISEQIFIIDTETGQIIPINNHPLEQIIVINDEMPEITPVIGNKNYAVVHKDYVLDYTSPLKNVIMEVEKGDGGLTYRYTYGLQKNSVTLYDIPNGAGSLLEKQIYPNGAEDTVKLYYHHDHIGSTDYLTDNIAGKVTSYATYDDFGELTAKAIVKMGLRMLDLVQEYTGHPYDQVPGLYYAKARMYDAADRRFMSKDVVPGSLAIPLSLNRYIYVLDNPLKYVDPFGLSPIDDLKNIDISTLRSININNSIYYHVGDVFEALGGEVNRSYAPQYLLKLQHNNKTIVITFDLSNVTKWDRLWNINTSISGNIMQYSGTALRNESFLGTIALVFSNKNNLTYFKLDDLQKYFEKIWCEELSSENDLSKKLNGHKQYITFEMMKSFGWAGYNGTDDKSTETDLIALNDMLYRYSITDMRSIRLFMATCGHESNKGRSTIEDINNDGTTVGAYTPNERGAGYIQITWRNTHLEFLKSVEDSTTVSNTAKYIAETYPWEAAGWFWSVSKMTGKDNLNNYVVAYGDSINVFLITQYFVNGWAKGLNNDIAASIRAGNEQWEIKNNQLFVNDKSICTAPNGWVSRNENYEAAMKSFK